MQKLCVFGDRDLIMRKMRNRIRHFHCDFERSERRHEVEIGL